MSHAQVITLSNGNARRTTRRFQNKLQKLAQKHPTLHHYPTSSIDDIPGVLDDVHARYPGQPLHFVKVSGDGGYHHLITALAHHSLLDEYALPGEGYCLPDLISASPTGHGTQNVVAKRAGIKPRKILSQLPALAHADHADTLDVEVMKMTDEQRSAYGFMFTTGPMMEEASKAYHEGRFGAFSLITLITNSTLSLIPGIGNLPWLRRHYQRLFEPTTQTTFTSDNASTTISYGAFVAAAETLTLGPLHVWHKEEGNIHANYGSVETITQGLHLLYQLVRDKPITTPGVTSLHIPSLTLEHPGWYSIDDEPYHAEGNLELTRAGRIKIPRLLTNH